MTGGSKGARGLPKQRWGGRSGEAERRDKESGGHVFVEDIEVGSREVKRLISGFWVDDADADDDDDGDDDDDSSSYKTAWFEVVGNAAMWVWKEKRC